MTLYPQANASRSLKEVIIPGLLVALALNAVCLWPVIHREFNKSAAFSIVDVGMSAGQAQTVLEEYGVSCGLTLAIGSRECTFSDIWRDYIIQLDSGHKFVRLKVANVRRPWAW